MLIKCIKEFVVKKNSTLKKETIGFHTIISSRYFFYSNSIQVMMVRNLIIIDIVVVFVVVMATFERYVSSLILFLNSLYIYYLLLLFSLRTQCQTCTIILLVLGDKRTMWALTLLVPTIH